MIMSGTWAQHCKGETIVNLLLIQDNLEQRNRYNQTVRLQITCKVIIFSKPCNKPISWRVCTRISMRCEIPYNGKIVPTVFCHELLRSRKNKIGHDRQSPRATVRLSLKVHFRSIANAVRESEIHILAYFRNFMQIAH